MAAVTTQREPVPGCTVERLGRMRYRPRASPSFVATWFPQGVTVAALAQAPLVVFDREDRLQDRYLRRRSRRRIEPPPTLRPRIGRVRPSHRPGLGMVSDLQSADGKFVELDPEGQIDVALYWQQWRLRTAALDRVTEAVRQAAAEWLQ